MKKATTKIVRPTKAQSLANFFVPSFGIGPPLTNATHRNAKAMMDHADIRGLVTAFHLSVAGLPTV